LKKKISKGWLDGRVQAQLKATGEKGPPGMGKKGKKKGGEEGNNMGASRFGVACKNSSPEDPEKAKMQEKEKKIKGRKSGNL